MAQNLPRTSSHTNATQGAIAPHPSNVGSILSSQHRHRHTAALAHVPNPAAHFDTSLSVPVRKYLQTYGLTPPNTESYDTQKRRALNQLALKTSDIERFLYLSALRKNNVHLFYRLLTDHFTELTPLVYTPVVGEACQRWSEIYCQQVRISSQICTVISDPPRGKICRYQTTYQTNGSFLGRDVSFLVRSRPHSIRHSKLATVRSRDHGRH